MSQKPSQPLSCFGRDRAALLVLVGGHERVVSELETVVAAHRGTPKGTLPALVRDFRTASATERKQLHDCEVAIGQCRERTERLLELLERLPAHSSAYQALAYFIATKYFGADPRALLEETGRLFEQLEAGARWAAEDTRPAILRAGTPGHIGRQVLENYTAHILVQAGIRLTKARGGTLAKVLQLVYEAADENYPLDLRDVINRLVEKAKSARLTGVPILAIT